MSLAKGSINLNLTFYKGDDNYSDGDIENELLNIVKTNYEYNDLLANDDRWPILYHLSPVRRNLLEWFPFRKNASIMEIGAGCGALTGLFCEKLKKVTVVELSKRRAEIIAYRYSEKKNLDIIVGNISDIQINKKFDYITLIGVIEYANKFIDSDEPVMDLLKIAKSFMKPSGTLIIAVENKFGLKYWAGAKEDHTGNLFEGLEGYINSNGIKTFSKIELTNILKKSGFNNSKYYYPMPDYKLPSEIFSDDYLPTIAIRHLPNYDRERITLFNEKLVLYNLVKDNLFEHFANSFLVFANC